MLQTLEQISEQIPAAETALDAALQAGEPSRPYRNEVARLEAELATAQQSKAGEKAVSAALGGRSYPGCDAVTSG
jgi:hypothetical protein